MTALTTVVGTADAGSGHGCVADAARGDRIPACSAAGALTGPTDSANSGLPGRSSRPARRSHDIEAQRRLLGGVGGAHFGGHSRRLNVAGWQAMSLIVPPYPPARYNQRSTGGQCLAEASARRTEWTLPITTRSASAEVPLRRPTSKPPAAITAQYRVDDRPEGRRTGPALSTGRCPEAFFVLSGTVKLYDGTDWIGRTSERLPLTSHPAASTASETRPTSRRRS